MKNSKAFSAITIKSFNDDAREIEGIASTPVPDLVDDIVDPLGLTFEPDAPLLLNHNPEQPVGTVQFGTPTEKGLPFKATIAKVEEPGVVKDRTDEAWHSVKARLIKGVSIGFKPKEAVARGVNKGIHYKSAAVHELSLVSIPCNPQAVITAFKSLQAAEADGATTSEAPGESSDVVPAVGTTPDVPVVKTPRTVAIDRSLRRY